MEPFTLVNLDSEESHDFPTLALARQAVRSDRLRAYSIWNEGERVEHCDPYDGDDDRVKQALGLPNFSEQE